MNGLTNPPIFSKEQVRTPTTSPHGETVYELIGVAPQVLWREGQKATIMKFQGPESIILGTGRVLRNIETPPSGGCRTSVELELDDVADCRDTKGFHQLFIYGDLELPFKAYCQLAGINVVHI